MVEDIDSLVKIITKLFEAIIWISLGFGTVVLVLKSLGLLPTKLKDLFERNGANDIKEIFYKLNITPNAYVDGMRALTLAYLSDTNSVDDATIRSKITEAIKERTFRSSLAWGDENNSYHLKQYIDLQGLTYLPEVNKVFSAYILKLINNRIRELTGTSKPLYFDCIAVHENAAPFLGYELSARMKVPLVFIKNNRWDKYPEAILHGQEVSPDRKSFTFAGKKLERAIFVADFLMLAPHLGEARQYLNKFGVELQEVFLLAHGNVDGCRQKLEQDGFILNYWVPVDF